MTLASRLTNSDTTGLVHHNGRNDYSTCTTVPTLPDSTLSAQCASATNITSNVDGDNRNVRPDAGKIDPIHSHGATPSGEEQAAKPFDPSSSTSPIRAGIRPPPL